jgi:hypothetical protein
VKIADLSYFQAIDIISSVCKLKNVCSLGRFDMSITIPKPAVWYAILFC